MLCKGTVKHKAVLSCFQRHSRFLRHLRLQMPHLLGGEVGRVGYDQIKLPFRQALPVGEQVALHRLHRIGWLCLCAQSVQRRPPVKGRGICLLKGSRLQQVLRLPALPFQGAAAVLFQINKSFRAFFHAGHLRRRAEALDAQPQTAGPRAEIQHPGRCNARQGIGSRFRYHLSVCPGAEHTGANGKVKIQKAPDPAQVLQRFPLLTARAEGFQLFRFLRGQHPVGKAGIPPGCHAEQLPCIVIGIRTPCSGKPGFHGPHRFARGQTSNYHLPSSGSSGSTGVTAAMATSIMLSSGSNTVRCCTQMPGWRMMRVAMLSERPHHLSSS